MHTLQEETGQVAKDKDEWTRRELEIEGKRMSQQIERFEDDAGRFASDYEKEKERLEARLAQMEFNARQEAGRVAAQYEQQIYEPKSSLEANVADSGRDKALVLEKIEELSRRKDQARKHPLKPGFFFPD